MAHQMKITRMAFLLGAVMMFYLWSTPAQGHRALMEGNDIRGLDTALVILHPQASYALYGRLDSGQDVDFYRFEATSPMELNLSVLVPRANGYQEYYPTYALVGPGMGAPESALPFDLPEGYGAKVIMSPHSADREKFYEPFSMTRYYRDTTELRMTAEVPGTYYIAVWHDAGEIGEYTVSFGEAEKWDLMAMVETYKVVGKIWAGDWGGDREKLVAKMAPEDKGVSRCHIVVPEDAYASVPIESDSDNALLGVFAISCT